MECSLEIFCNKEIITLISSHCLSNHFLQLLLIANITFWSPLGILMWVEKLNGISLEAAKQQIVTWSAYEILLEFSICPTIFTCGSSPLFPYSCTL
jgi:hypothetical protein